MVEEEETVVVEGEEMVEVGEMAVGEEAECRRVAKRLPPFSAGMVILVR